MQAVIINRSSAEGFQMVIPYFRIYDIVRSGSQIIFSYDSGCVINEKIDNVNSVLPKKQFILKCSSASWALEQMQKFYIALTKNQNAFVFNERKN